MGQAVVGLGNPGPEYRHTRHNVGQRVLDELARRLRAPWRPEGPALVARSCWAGELLALVKPLAYMNVAGPAVEQALRRLDAAPADLILVHDDLDLPLGTVRVRLRGGHGGHNGVRSVIEALGSDQIRRVKVGIGRPERRSGIVDHVLAAFEPDEWPVVEVAVATAADRVLALAGPRAPTRADG